MIAPMAALIIGPMAFSMVQPVASSLKLLEKEKGKKVGFFHF